MARDLRDKCLDLHAMTATAAEVAADRASAAHVRLAVANPASNTRPPRTEIFREQAASFPQRTVQLPEVTATPVRQSLQERLAEAQKQWTSVQEYNLDVAAIFVGAPILGTLAASLSVPTTLIIVVLIAITFPVWWVRTKDWKTAGQSAFVVAAGATCLTYSWWGSDAVWTAIVIGLAAHCLGAYLSYQNSLGE